ncbi:hypothetical protein [Vulcanisaeta distributa]|uniref:hypothetical protein n=1 Tax=Vulcanisaeta distributa TaxID=164451 RepID=UPI000A5980D1|nr:hypothetical protein [Vulcanisaeta distributa]
MLNLLPIYIDNYCNADTTMIQMLRIAIKNSFKHLDETTFTIPTGLRRITHRRVNN